MIRFRSVSFKGKWGFYMNRDGIVWQQLFPILLWAGGIWLFFRYLLSPLLPFLLALGLSILLEPTVQRLKNATGVTRSFAAVMLTTGLLLILGTALTTLFMRLGAELSAWSARLPATIDAFPALWNGTLSRFEHWYASSPPFLRTALDHLAAALGENATSFVAAAGGLVMEKASSFASKLPSISLFCITTILALYFTCISYNNILTFVKRQLPAPWQKRCRATVQCCRRTMLRWLRSELLLIFVTFLILLLGFWWMKLPYALLAAFCIALVDALPVLGTGTILLPWSAVRFLMGDMRQGLSLLILYAAALLIHSLLEPRLLAGQADLPPLTMLVSMYLGFHFRGIGGMVLFPVLLLLLKQLQDAEVIKLWR